MSALLQELSGLGVPPAQVYLEMGHVHSTYREADRAQRMFYKARDLTGMLMPGGRSGTIRWRSNGWPSILLHWPRLLYGRNCAHACRQIDIES